MNEPKVNTIFHGNCEPEITHHSEGGYTVSFLKESKNGSVLKRTFFNLDQVKMKAFSQICQDALAHENIITTHKREENDGRKPETTS